MPHVLIYVLVLHPPRLTAAVERIRAKKGADAGTTKSNPEKTRAVSWSDREFNFIGVEEGPVTRRPSFVEPGGTPGSSHEHADIDIEAESRSDFHSGSGKQPVIVFRDMCAYTWAGTPILQHVSGYLCEGQIMGVIGLYGSGKTTFLHGLIATGDELVGKGSRIYKGNTFALPNIRVGYVGDESLPLEYLTVREAILYAILLDSPGLDDERVEKRMQRWVSKLDLMSILYQPMNVLSTGQRRRVDLVLVLVRACNLMVMDEPLTALDSYTGVEIMREIRNIADTEKISVIISLSQLKAEVSVRCSSFQLFRIQLLLFGCLNADLLINGPPWIW